MSCCPSAQQSLLLDFDACNGYLSISVGFDGWTKELKPVLVVLSLSSTTFRLSLVLHPPPSSYLAIPESCLVSHPVNQLLTITDGDMDLYLQRGHQVLRSLISQYVHTAVSIQVAG